MSYRAWLIRVLINKCYNIRKHYAGMIGLEEIEEPAVEDESNLELKDVVASLGETYSIVMTLYYGLGYNTNEIAKILGITPGTVRVRLKRGRRKLKEYYDADSKTAAITFLVSGVDGSINSGNELLFEWIRPELDEGLFAGASGHFYSDKIIDENGTEGFEFVMSINSIGNGQTASLLGRQLHVELGRLALSGGKAEIGETLTEGTWAFDISLPEKDPAITKDVELPLSETVYTVDQIILSPLSLQVFTSEYGIYRSA